MPLNPFRESRKFIRHAVHVPVEVHTVASSPATASHGVDISHGGLSFRVDERMTEGQIITLRMPTISPPFEAKARVVWCRPEGARYLIGVAFMDEHDAFHSRMVEQVCAIETYRHEAMKKGRNLTPADAAAEWVKKYADKFPT